MNSIQIIGRLTKDPDTTTTKAGQALCRMRVAVPRPGSDAEPVYIDVVAWECLAETCGEYLAQGRQVAVSGRLDYSEWNDAEGARHSRPRDRGQRGRLPRPAEDQGRRGRVGHAGGKGAGFVRPPTLPTPFRISVATPVRRHMHKSHGASHWGMEPGPALKAESEVRDQDHDSGPELVLTFEEWAKPVSTARFPPTTTCRSPGTAPSTPGNSSSPWLKAVGVNYRAGITYEELSKHPEANWRQVDDNLDRFADETDRPPAGQRSYPSAGRQRSRRSSSIVMWASARMPRSVPLAISRPGCTGTVVPRPSGWRMM